MAYSRPRLINSNIPRYREPHNTIERGGGDLGGEYRGAMWILAGSAPISHVTITDNLIKDSLFRGLHLTGQLSQEMTFRNNTIVNPGGDGIYIESIANGSGTFTDNTVTGLKTGYKDIKNASPTYHVRRDH